MTKVKKLLYFFSDRKLTVSTAMITLMITGLVSNFLGLAREVVFASFFGVNNSTIGIYLGSFRLPDLIYNLVILGALSSAFIPIFIEKRVSDREKAWEYASNILNFFLVLVILFSLIIFLFTPQLLPFVMPGYFWSPASQNTTEFQTAVNITRMLTLSPILFAIMGIFTGILQSLKKFIYASLAPIIYNVSIIFFTIYININRTEPTIYAPVLGVITGALLGVLIMVPSLLKSGFRWNFVWDLRNKDFIKTLRLMGPRALAIGVSQINLLVDTVVASFLVGGIAILAYANNIQTLPTAVFVISMATAIFPFLAEYNASNDTSGFLKTFSWATRRILFFIIPATIGLIVLRAQIIRLIYGSDIFNKHAFGWEATSITAQTLAFFAIGLVGQALIPILLRAFYAKEDTKTPLYIGLLVMVVNISLSVSLAIWVGLGVPGIALAFSISGYINAILLFYYLHKKIGALDRDHKIFDSTFRLVSSSVIMGVVVYYSLYFFDFFINTSRVIGLTLQTTLAVGVGAITYFLLAYLFHCEEIYFVIDKFSRFKVKILPKTANENSQ